MTRTRYLLAWACYKIGDLFEAIGCPTFAAGVDWFWKTDDITRAELFILAVVAVLLVFFFPEGVP